MAPTHFRLDTRNLTWRECWWQTRGPAFLILAFCKVFRIRLPGNMVLPAISRLADLEVPVEAVPPEAMARIEQPLAELTALGFHSPTYYRYADSRDSAVTHVVALLHASGDAIVRVMHVVMRNVHPPQQKVRVVFLSQLRDGTLFVGAANRPELEGPPGVKVFRRINASPTELWRAFAAELDRLRATNPPQPLPDRVTAERVSDDHERQAQEFNLARKFYVPLAEAEVGEEHAAAAAQQQVAAEAGSDQAAILAELDKVLTEKPKWTGSLWILGLSLVAFLAAGAAQWDWEFVLVLVPILFFHEAGHWLAMKVFGYRNLRMFFIPLFGAAVTGRHFNVPGWKKALVSLAGPAPGIVLATGLAFAAIWLDQPWLEKAVLVTLLLNAFNLLPFLPLDGGWYLNSVLFCRNFALEVGFKVFAILGLFAAFFLSHDRIWMFLGIMMAISLPFTWRMSRLANRLRREGVPAQSLDQQTIPQSTALRLIEAVRASTTQSRPSRAVATEALEVFERLNARPPGVLATLVLLVAYVGVLAIGFVGFGAHSLAGGGVFGLLATLADEEERFPSPPLDLGRTVACQDMAAWRGPGTTPAVTNALLLAATFPSASEAEDGWQRLQRVPANRASRLGRTVLGVFPAAEGAAMPLLREWQTLGTNLAVWDARSNLPVVVDLTCELPDPSTATNLFQELEDHFDLPFIVGAIPPWLTNAPLTAQHRDARYTLRRLREADRAISRNRELRKAQRELFRAFSRGNTNALDAAGRKLESVRHRLLTEAEDRLLATNDARLVRALVELQRTERAQPEGERDHRKLAAARGELVGVLPSPENSPEPTGLAVTAHGSAELAGTRLTLRGLVFGEADLGLPALVQWLCDQGGSEVRFELRSGADEDDE